MISTAGSMGYRAQPYEITIKLIQLAACDNDIESEMRDDSAMKPCHAVSIQPVNKSVINCLINRLALLAPLKRPLTWTTESIAQGILFLLTTFKYQVL